MDLRDHKGKPEKPDLRDHLDRPVSLENVVSKDLPDQLVSKVIMAHRVHPVSLEKWENLELQEMLECPVNLENVANAVSLVNVVQLALWANLVHAASPVNREMMVQRGPKERRGRKALPDLKVSWVTLEIVVPKDHRVHLVNAVMLAHKVQLVLKV